MTGKLIRMWSGEDVITDIVEETNDYYVIENPIVAVPSPQEGRIAFAPWSPLLQKDKIEIKMEWDELNKGRNRSPYMPMSN